VRSAAVRFLGRSSRPELREQLLAAMEDSDGRVQANALEAMDEAGWPDLVGLIVPKLHSEHTRVRANAAKALARAGDEEATRVLTEMLEDSRAECRLAAIRAIKQIGAETWLEKLAELAEKDSSAAVRRQAAAVCAELQGSGRQVGRQQRQETAGKLQGPADNNGNDGSAGLGGVPADPQNDNQANSDDHKDTAQAEAWTPNDGRSMAAHDAAMAPGNSSGNDHAPATAQEHGTRHGTREPLLDSSPANDAGIPVGKVPADPAVSTPKVPAAAGVRKGRP
jgi:HEAT repeat protein